MAASKRGVATRGVGLPSRRARSRSSQQRREDGHRLAAPSLRSALAGVAILALAAGAYVAARETPVFAVRTLAISGGSPRVQAEVRKALAHELGESLLAVSGSSVSRRAQAIPDVVSVRFDRSFPHTLKVSVTPERAALLLRQGTMSWVVSARGRVMRKLAGPKRSTLPRAWISKKVPITLGEALPRLDGALAAAAVAPIARGAYPGHVRTVTATATSLTLVMRKGTQIRVGDIGNLRLKLAIAVRVLRLAAKHESTSDVYVDVSVPGRPVLGSLNPQVAGTG